MILQLVYTPIEMIKSIAPDIESMSEPAVRKPSEGSCIDGTLIPMWLLWPVCAAGPHGQSDEQRSTINDQRSSERAKQLGRAVAAASCGSLRRSYRRSIFVQIAPAHTRESVERCVSLVAARQSMPPPPELPTPVPWRPARCMGQGTAESCTP